MQPNKDPCQKRCETIMIGSIQKFEENFGILWGHDIDLSEKTRQEKEWFEIWQETRDKILDLGNAQIKKYFYDIKIIGKNRNDN